jgi:hypothetical protein
MKLGAEPRKLAILAVLLAVAAVLMYQNIFSASGGEVAAPARRAAPLQQALNTAATQTPRAGPAPAQPSRTRAGNAVQEFRPSLKPKRPEDRPDPARIDPALQLDLLARLQSVTVKGGMRSLFEFAAAPPPKVEEPKIIPRPVQGPKPPPKPEDSKRAEIPKAPPPPIPLKFYGYIQPKNAKEARRAFFLQGEDIFVVSEGQTVNARYRIVRIEPNSAIVEDTEHKSEQSLPLEQPPKG